VSARPLSPQCGVCRRLTGMVTPRPVGGIEPTPRAVCTAFPAGIPETIWAVETDHRRPVRGDHGQQFVALPGAVHPLAEAGPRPAAH
jgi:hypothetical protein